PAVGGTQDSRSQRRCTVKLPPPSDQTVHATPARARPRPASPGGPSPAARLRRLFPRKVRPIRANRPPERTARGICEVGTSGQEIHVAGVAREALQEAAPLPIGLPSKPCLASHLVRGVELAGTGAVLGGGLRVARGHDQLSAALGASSRRTRRPGGAVSTDASRADADSSHAEPDRPGEPEAQRDDRNVMELLNELRMVGIGVQVLFGFLLALPFANRFTKLYTAQHGLYLTTV